MSRSRITLLVTVVVFSCVAQGPCDPRVIDPGKAAIAVVNDATVDLVGFYLADSSGKTAGKAQNLLPAALPPGGRYDGIEVPAGTYNASLVIAQTDPNIPAEFQSDSVPLAPDGSYEFGGTDAGMSVSAAEVPALALSSLQFANTIWRTSPIWVDPVPPSPTPLPKAFALRNVLFYLRGDGYFNCSTESKAAESKTGITWRYDPAKGVLTLTQFGKNHDLTIVGYVNAHYISVESPFGVFSMKYIGKMPYY